MTKIAQYNKRMRWLTYWNSHNTQLTINCRTKKCAELVLLTQKNMHHVSQQLQII